MGRCLQSVHQRQRRRHGDGLDDPCPYCAASIREGIFSPDLHRLDPAVRTAVANFWTQVEVPICDDIAIVLIGCWSYAGPRLLHLNGRSFTPQQLMFSFCWGDQGPWALEHICDHKHCVNPFHLRVGELGQPPVDLLLPWPEGFEDAMDRITHCNDQTAAHLQLATDTLPAPQSQRLP